MLPGAVIIRKCRKCGSEYSERTLMSGNTFGAIMWSDGLMLAPMLPDSDYLIKCPQCKNLTWIDDDKIVRKLELHDENFDNLYRPEYLRPEKEDFFNAIKDHSINTETERERYLRIKYWQQSNRKFRGGKNLDQKFTADESENLYKLIEHLDQNSDEDNIMMAEIYRELGEFNKCIELLDKNFPDEFQSTVEKIRTKATEKYPFVFQL